MILAAVKTQYIIKSSCFFQLRDPRQSLQSDPRNSFSCPISYDRCCHMPVIRLPGLRSSRTAFHHCGVGSVGSCSGILYCVQLHPEEKLWKMLFLCVTSLARSVSVDTSSEMEARRTLWLSRYKVQDCLFGSSLAFFINIFCSVMAYKQLKWKAICRDYNFIKEEKTKQNKAQHFNILGERGPNHSLFYTHQNGLS